MKAGCAIPSLIDIPSYRPADSNNFSMGTMRIRHLGHLAGSSAMPLSYADGTSTGITLRTSSPASSLQTITFEAQ